ncbi:MAG: 6-bladed beta-propeller [Parabacteroides sp.]|nr:6-bladed beta-propeller [Parabacteroides sp.]
MKLQIIAVNILMLLSCCQNNEVSQNNEMLIDIDISDMESFEFQNTYDSIVYIPLENDPSSLISSVDKLYMTDSNFVVFDAKQMLIFVFDKTGHFQNLLGTKGMGKNEYMYWNDVIFSPKDDLVYAHERYQNKIFIYDLSGRLISISKASKQMFNSFARSEHGYYIYSCFKKPFNPQGFNLMCLDEDLQESNASFFPQEEFVNVKSGSTFSLSANGELYFYYPSSNVIYQLESDSVIPSYKLDFGKHTLPYNEIVHLPNTKAYEQCVSNQGYVGDVNNWMRNQNWISFEFSETDFNKPIKNYYCMYHLNEHKCYLDESPFIMTFDAFPISRKVVYMNNEGVIYLLYPFMLSENSLDLLSKQLRTSITSESNPILVYCMFKKP